MIPFNYVTILFVLSISLADSGLSPLKDGSDYRAVNMIFVVDAAALGTGTGLFASISVFPSQYYSTNAPCSHFIRLPSTLRGTRWCNWLRLCATSRKVAGSISDAVRNFSLT